MYPAAPLRPPAQAGHVGLGPAFVDEDQPRRVEPALKPPPLLACLQDIGAVLLAGTERLFLYVSSMDANA
jgi:hypothetical protein